MIRLNWRILLAASILYLAVSARTSAQTATVMYDYPSTTPAATVQAYTAKLKVNGVVFILNDTCALTGVAPTQVVTCTAPLPNISAALTVSGSQTFVVTLTDTIPDLESPPSNPLVLTRPSAPTVPRIQ